MDVKPSEQETPQMSDPLKRFLIAAEKVSKNEDAVKILAFGEKFVEKVNLAGMLELTDPLEAHFITHLVADRFSRDRKSKGDREETEGEKIFKEFLEADRGFVIRNLGEERTRTIELAIHAVLTSGLVEGGKARDTVGNRGSMLEFKVEDLKEWGAAWRKRLEENPPVSSKGR